MDNMESIAIVGNGNFQFSGLCTDALDSTEYTLVSIIVDRSGSVYSFSNEIDKAVDEVIKACAKSPTPENLLIRQVNFSTQYPTGLDEVHGFIELKNIPPKKSASCNGGTPLFDAVYTGVEASLTYAETRLIKNGYTANGCVFIITDGDDTGSSNSPKMIKKRMEEAIKGERIESLQSFLIGINDTNCQSYLDRFKNEANLTDYKSLGDITPAKLAHMANWISKSVSSQAQARGSGGPSQVLPLTI